MENSDPSVMFDKSIIIKKNNEIIKEFVGESTNEIANSIMELKSINVMDCEKTKEKIEIEIDLASIKINPFEKNNGKDKLNHTNESIQPLHPFFSKYFTDDKPKNSHEKELISFSDQDRILLFSPHPDDEILGACALLHKCFTEMVNINVVYLTSGKTAGDIYTRQNEAKEGIKILNGKVENLQFDNMPFYERKDRTIKEDDYEYVRAIIRKHSPNVVFICADIFDPNKTHHKCFDILIKVLFEEEFFKNIDIYFYYSVWYVPNEDEYSHILPYNYDVYKLKVFAMLEHKSQMNTNFMGNNSLPFYVRGVLRDEQFGNLNKYEYCEVYYKIDKMNLD
jgi:LmbE family N-acetylglucosaminyl deacetylase